MLGEITKIIKNLGLIGAVITALIVVGNAIDYIMNPIWEHLTNFFSIARKIISLSDTFIDTGTLIVIIGITLSLMVSFWTFRMIMWAVGFFKN